MKDFEIKRKLRKVTYYVPKDESWSDRIVISREEKYFTVTETAWDLIKYKIREKYDTIATLIKEEGDELYVFLPMMKQKEEEPSD